MRQHGNSMTHAQRRDRRARLAEAVRLGKRPEEVARTFEVPRRLVVDACREHGVPSRTPRPKPPKGVRVPQTRPLLILAALLNTPEPENQIAERHGISRQAVCDIFTRAKAAGVRFPHRI